MGVADHHLVLDYRPALMMTAATIVETEDTMRVIVHAVAAAGDNLILIYQSMCNGTYHWHGIFKVTKYYLNKS